MTVRERVEQFEKDHGLKAAQVYINGCLAGIEDQEKTEYVDGTIDWEPNIEPTWVYLTMGAEIRA